MLLLTLRGTPTLYYGDEIGMTDVKIATEEVQDPFEKNEPGKGLGRDPERTPMQWSDAPHAGFTSGEPWLRLGDDAATRNVAAQTGDESSMLELYRRLLALRRRHTALHEGVWVPVTVEGDVLAYARTHGNERMLVVLNFGNAAAPLPAGVAADAAQLHLSTDPARQGAIGPGTLLMANEGLILGA